MQIDTFTHLNVHSEYSIQEGACKIEKIVQVAKENGQKAIALTDNGNLFGCPKFYLECIQNGIKPIIGCTVFVCNNMEDKKDKNIYKLVLLVMNEKGYKNLCKIVSLGAINGYTNTMRVDFNLLSKYSEGLIALTGPYDGIVSKHILDGNVSLALENAKKLKQIYKYAFIELNENTLPFQKKLNIELLKIAKQLEMPIVATNNCYYAKKEDKILQDILYCVQYQQKLSDKERHQIPTDQLYIKNSSEMENLFSHLLTAIENTKKIASLCNFEFEFGNTILPNFETPNNIPSFEYLSTLVQKGKEKFYRKENYKTEQEYNQMMEKVEKRIAYELEIISSMGFTDYFLIVQDFVDYAKKNNIKVGPGRGSGVGSLIAYLLEITAIDPIKYNLLFERFLNPQRVSMPDFDIDFEDQKRPEIISYVTKKYGADKVANIMAFNTLGSKAAIKDIGRVLDVDYAKVDALTKRIKDSKKTIKQILKEDEIFNQAVYSDDQYTKIIELAKRVESFPRNLQIHASGIVITKDPLIEHIPLYSMNDGILRTQYPGTMLEKIGILKMDFLGIRNLSVISNTEKIIRKEYGEDHNIYPQNYTQYDDMEVIKLWQKGDTKGVFQFESDGMINAMKKMNPQSFEDIIAGIALYRPGPKDELNNYIQNKEHPENIVYDHPLLEPILKVTYGSIIYQEQVMEISKALANFTLGDADLLRRAISKKDLSEMEKEKEKFLQGCMQNNIPKQVAISIFDKIHKFANYAFNKSHSTAYSAVAYNDAFLKKYYPRQFITALMNSLIGDLDKTSEYVKDAKRHGIKIMPPDINLSEEIFVSNKEKNAIVFALGSVKNAGEIATGKIIQIRKEKGNFKSFDDFIQKTKSVGINKKVIESLIKVGAFDSIEPSRKALVEKLEQMQDDTQNKKQLFDYSNTMFDFLDVVDEKIAEQNKQTENKENEENNNKEEQEQIQDYTQKEKLDFEMEYLGIYVSAHPLEKVVQKLKKMITFNSRQLEDPDQKQILKEKLKNPKQYMQVSFVGVIQDYKIKKNQNGKRTFIVNAEDLDGKISFVLFENTFGEYTKFLTKGNIVGVNGYIKYSDYMKDLQLIGNNITNIVVG